MSGIIVGLILCNTGVALRFLARRVGRLKVTIDDYLMLLALVIQSTWAVTRCC